MSRIRGTLVADSRYPGRGFAAARSNLAGAHGVSLVTLMMLETRADPKKGFHTLYQHDHATWRSLVDLGLITGGPTITHGNKDEPLWWVVDLLAGARSDHLCAVGRGTYPLMAHRVSRVTTVAG